MMLSIVGKKCAKCVLIRIRGYLWNTLLLLKYDVDPILQHRALGDHEEQSLHGLSTGTFANKRGSKRGVCEQ